MAKPLKSADWSIAYACLALKCSLWLAGALTAAPLQRILEATVCRSHYHQEDISVVDASDNVSEQLCKIAGVQKVVADINGVTSALDTIPALLATLLYLTLLPRFQPKRLLLLNTCGFFLMQSYYATVLYFYGFFDVRWTYLTGLFAFIGGGLPVFNSLVPALIAGSVPQSLLSTFQLYSSAIALLVEITGRSASLFMMKTSLWLPVILGLAVYATTILIILIFFNGSSNTVHTSSKAAKAPRSGYIYRPLNDDDNDDKIELEEVSNKPHTNDHHAITSSSSVAPVSPMSPFRQYRSVFIHSLLPIAVISLRDMGVTYRFIMPYWMSRRYHWEIREVGWVLLGQTLFMALVVAVLPSFAKTFLHQTPVFTPASNSMSTTASISGALQLEEQDQSDTERASDQNAATRRLARHDLNLAKACVFFSMIGTLLLGFSWYRFPAIASIAILAGGTGFQDAYFSFLANETTKNKVDDLTKIYMMLSMMALVSTDLGGWATSGIYSVALKIDADSWWTSAPVWFCTGSFVISFFALRRHQ